jgi:predicted Zn finger-like uncharacterized protein
MGTDEERIAKLEELARRPGTRGEGIAAHHALARVLGARIAQPPYKLGERIYTGLTKVRCKNCGSAVFRIDNGIGPHAAAVRCGRCDGFVKWLKREIVMSVGVDVAWP